MKHLLKSLALFFGFVFANTSGAATIDFSSLPQNKTLGIVDGVTFDQPGTHSGLSGFQVFDFGGISGNYAYNGFGEDNLGFTFGNAVTLNSIDVTRDPLCCGGSNDASIDILLYGSTNNLLRTISVAGGTDWQTITIEQQGVTRVVFDVASFFNPYDGHVGDHDWFGLDNITFTNLNNIPEPSVLALFGLAIASLGFSPRNRKF